MSEFLQIKHFTHIRLSGKCPLALYMFVFVCTLIHMRLPLFPIACEFKIIYLTRQNTIMYGFCWE